jgi:hypothetical protein
MRVGAVKTTIDISAPGRGRTMVVPLG